MRFYPIKTGIYYGEKVDGTCNSECGADGPIDGDKSPYDNIAFFFTSPSTAERFAVGNINWADHMLKNGITCFRAKNEHA